MLVAGTLVYGRGDDAEETDHKTKLTEHGAPAPAGRRIAFRPTHSIAGVPSRSAYVNRWHKARRAAAACAALGEGGQHAAAQA